MHSHVKRVRVHHISGLLVIAAIFFTFIISFSAEPQKADSQSLNEGGWVNTGSVLPGVVAGSQVVVIGEYIYLFGGFTDSFVYTNVIYRAPITNPTAWINTGATIPGILGQSQAIIIGDYVYLFGGHNGFGYLNVIYRAPTSNPLSWTNTGATLPENIIGSQIEIIGDYVYLFGGEYLSQIYRASLSNPLSWTVTGSALPSDLYVSQVAVVGDYIYLFGGFNYVSFGYVNVIYRAPVSNPTAWINTGATIPGILGQSQLVVVGDYIYLFGGNNGSAFTNVIYRAPTSNPLSWTNTGATLPGNLGWSQAAILGDYVYLFGGSNGPGTYGVSNATNAIFRAPITSLPTAPQSLNATSDADSISLTWNTPSSNGGSAITGYKIYRGTSSNPTVLLTSVGVVNTFDDTTASPNTTYYYRVVATNAIGDSPYSNEDSAIIALPQCVVASGGTPVTGYAWSDTIGWIDFNCQNSGTCGASNFGVAIANDGTFSGCAWSANVGWVSASANDLLGCPSGTCTARMQDLALRGWMKVLSANDPQSGGWDGFISLSGTSPTYGPTLASSTLSGYAWGDTNVGWVSFNAGSNPVQTAWLPACASTYVCTDSTHRQNACTNAPIEACSTGLICSAGTCTLPPAPFTASGGELRVSPSFIGYNNTVTVSWNVQSATSCTVTEDNPGIDDSWSTLSGSETSSPLTRMTTYTLFCTGLGGNLTQTATVSRRPDWREI